LTFAFSEAVTGFDNSDVSVSGGTLSAVTPDAGDPSGKTYKATFTPTAGVDATTATI
jgi:Bacterial Ig-like domain